MNIRFRSLAIACFLVAPNAFGVTVSTSQLNFGTQEIFTSDAKQRFNVTNASYSRWEQINSFFFSNRAFSRTSTNCPQWLAPRQVCFWEVTFKPPTTGLNTGRLSVWGSLGTATVDVRGYGAYPIVKKWGPKKWHPGHYAQLPPVGTSRREIDKAIAPAEIKGALLQYDWAKLERARGVFDFSQIEADLNYLRSRGKRLGILVNDKTFFGDELDCVPSDMKWDSAYQGGQLIRRDSSGAVKGCIAKRWVPAVMDRFIALHKALSDRFDDEPFVEAVATEETSISMWPYPQGFTERAYMDQLKRLGTAMSEAYVRTIFEIWTNWNINPPGELIDHLHRYGIGIGGPDTSPLHDTQVVPEFTSKYARKVPILMAVQPSFLTWNEHPIGEGKLTLDDVFDYAVTDPNGINANHLWWWFFEKQWSPGADYDFYDTVNLIKRRNGYINTTCPENLTCNWW